MDVVVKSLLEDPIFADAEILAGKNGISRLCRRISVFDCPYHKEILEEGVIKEGDLFLSCLEQFRQDSTSLRGFAESLVQYRSAGLLVIPTGALDVLSREILSYFDRENFPVIVIRSNFSYGDIMSAVNRRLHVEDTNARKLSLLRDIMSGNLDEAGRLRTIRAVNPDFGEQIRAIYVSGMLRSQSFQTQLLRDIARIRQASVVSGRFTLFLLSGGDQKKVRSLSNMISEQLGNYFTRYRVGYSRIHPLAEIREVLREGELAVRLSSALELEQLSYNPLLTEQLMFTLKDSTEAREFYRAYVDTISGALSGNMLQEYLHTVELFVAHKGNYAEVAQELNQHVNTVRYRMNRVKQVLNMEDDPIRFYETISIASKLGICFAYEKLNKLQKKP